jgi:alpha-glucosidase
MKTRFDLLVLSAFLSGAGLHAADTTSLSDGISMVVGGQTVEVRVASPHAFRLHVFTSPQPTNQPNIFLSGQTQPAAAFTQITEPTGVGIKTAFGELLVDPSANKWMLRDANGKTLADWGALPSAAPAGFEPPLPVEKATPDETAAGTTTPPPPPAAPVPLGPRLQLSAGASPDVPKPLYYGSGSIPNRGAIIQTAADSAMGNGKVALPQYWSTARYGALMMTGSENQPGSWKANSSGGVDWIVPGAEVDLYLMPAVSLYDWLRDYSELTGFAPVPPRWSFGYLQSRWGWEDQKYIEDTLAHFRQDKLPVDAFILDFEWYTTEPDYSVKAEGEPAFVDFGYNAKLMSDPKNQMASYLKDGLHIVGIRKPRIGNSDNLAMARSKGWILSANPRDVNGGPTKTRNLDYANPDVRAWWEDNNKKFVEDGMAGFWNDEGETNFREYSYWNLAEVELFKQVNSGQRFWSLNRAFAPGMQRFGAAAWTGDIGADWKVLARTPGELLSYGLSGMPYAGCDIGGYRGTTTPEMLTRWMEAGVFFPVDRSHSRRRGIVPHFPWLSGPEAEAAIRKALDLRYQLIPFYYSLAEANTVTAAPLMRPLVMEFPDDPQVANLTDEWLMGTGLLAAPILAEGATSRSVYLPKDTWFDFGTNHTTQGPQTLTATAVLDQIPIYVRAGTLLPLGPVVQYTGQATSDPLEMQIYPGKDASFAFVEDDGNTLGYQSGAIRRTTFSWNDQTRTLSWKVEGTYQGSNVFSAMKAVLFSPKGGVAQQAALGRDGSLQFQ